jgi:hypothetical protein
MRLAVRGRFGATLINSHPCRTCALECAGVTCSRFVRAVAYRLAADEVRHVFEADGARARSPHRLNICFAIC